MQNTVNPAFNDATELQKYISLLEMTVAQVEENKKNIEQEKVRIETELQVLQLKYNSLLEQFRLSKQRTFAASSEKNIYQMNLFDEADLPMTQEANADIAQEDDTEVVAAYERKKKEACQAKRQALPDHLPREERIYDIPAAEKTCACCGGEKTCFAKDISEQLKVIPPQVVVVSHQRLKYCCKPCEGEISVAPRPDLFLPKSIADASLVAYTIIMKYADHIPLYRQEQIWARHKIELPRNTTCAWVMKAAELCTPLYQALRTEIIASAYVQADETRVQVLKEAGRKNTQQSYMWVYRKAMGAPLVFYEYQETREAKHPQAFLEGFKGHLQTDAYSGYEWLKNKSEIEHIGCMAHARRPFAELQKLSKKTKGLAYRALEMIGVLYQLETKIKDQTPEEKYNERQAHAKPQLEKIHAWLKEHISHTPPQGKLGLAMKYMLNHWKKLTAYIHDGTLHIDNNRVENAIRPFALGRKNWLFAGNPRGARASAILYSLLITAKENGLNEHAYLTLVFNRIRGCKTESDYQKLLPGYLTSEEIALLALK